jgi:flavin-binding protein dodecin
VATALPVRFGIQSGTARPGMLPHDNRVPAQDKETSMSIAKSSEISASSDKSFEDAVKKGIKRFSKTIDNIEGAWVKEQKVVVKDGDVSEYRVTMIVTFLLNDL